jgi:4-carboxymuconolactone decarboxylase
VAALAVPDPRLAGLQGRLRRLVVDRRKAGLEVMREIFGEEVTAEIEETFNAISPGFSDYTVEAAFGDVYTRPGLDLRQRQLLNVVIMTVLGGAERALAVHMRGALNVGVTPVEIVEAIFHSVLYVGHPRVTTAFNVAKEVFEEQGIALPVVPE